MSILYRSGKLRKSRTRIERPAYNQHVSRRIGSARQECAPMNVLMPQCGTVGVNSTVTRSGYLGSKVIWGAETTASCSSVMLRCSGSDIDRISSNIMRYLVHLSHVHTYRKSRPGRSPPDGPTVNTHHPLPVLLHLTIENALAQTSAMLSSI